MGIERWICGLLAFIVLPSCAPSLPPKSGALNDEQGSRGGAMDFDVYRYDDGYLVVLFPPLTAQEEEYRGLTAEQASALMVQQGGHLRDIREMQQEADGVYERGLTDLSRATVRAWRPARA